MGYKTTKEQCASKIGGVCSQCGGNLEPIETVDNSGNPTFWSGCVRCCRFDHGTDPKVYEVAKRMVVERNFRYYDHIRDEDSDTEDAKQYKTECQISGTCGLVREILFIHGQHLLKVL